MSAEQITDEVCRDATDMYNTQIPNRWMKVAGPGAPPKNWTLNAWMSDFQSRMNHLDKILMQVGLKSLHFL